MKKIYNAINELMAVAGGVGLDELIKSDNDKVMYFIDKVIVLVAEKIKEEDADIDNIMGELEFRYCDSESFWEFVKVSVDSQLIPYKEMSFFRALEFSKQKQLLDFVFKYTVLHLENPTLFYEQKDIDIEEIKCISKMLNTASKLIVERNVTKQYFYSEMHDLAKIGEDIADVIWKMYQNNIEQLRYNQMFKYLKRHDDEIKRFVKRK